MYIHTKFVHFNIYASVGICIEYMWSGSVGKRCQNLIAIYKTRCVHCLMYEKHHAVFEIIFSRFYRLLRCLGEQYRTRWTTENKQGPVCTIDIQSGWSFFLPQLHLHPRTFVLYEPYIFATSFISVVYLQNISLLLY